MPNQNAVAVRGESAPASMNQQHASVLGLIAKGDLNEMVEARKALTDAGFGTEWGTEDGR